MLKGTARDPGIEIQDIDSMRRREGIDDDELRDEVGKLRVGDMVKLTFVLGLNKIECLAVCITSKRGDKFHGKLVGQPRSAALARLANTSFAFTRAHIHSVLKRQESSPSK